MSVAIPDILLAVHISSSDGARFELVMVMGFSNIASFRLACEMGDWAMIKEVSHLFTDLALVVLLPIGHGKTWCVMVEPS